MRNSFTVNEHMTRPSNVIVPTLDEASREANAFRDNLLFIRQKYHLSLREMAKCLGVSHQTIDFWESGQRQPDNYNFMIINLWAKQIKQRLPGHTGGTC